LNVILLKILPRYLTIFIIFIINTQLLAQDYNWSIFNSNNSGIKDNFALSLALDKYENIWIGTKYSGLVKYDRYNWEIFLPDTSIQPHPIYKHNDLMYGPQYNAFYSIAIDKNETKWIGSKIGGLVKFDGEEWMVYDTNNSQLPHNYVWSVVIDKNDDKWLGTVGGGITKFDGLQWTIYDSTNSELPHNNVYVIVVDSSNNKWIGTEAGLAKFNGSTWEIYNSSNAGLPQKPIWAIAIDSYNNKWIGTSGGGLTIFNGSDWYTFNTSNSEIPENNILSIAIDSQNNKWIGTLNEGLTKYNDFDWHTYNKNTSMIPDNTIWDIIIDSKQNVWIGTNLGLVSICSQPTGLEIHNQINPAKPKLFSLNNIYPNPFTDITQIDFTIFHKLSGSISIFDIQGRFVKNIIYQTFNPGSYSVSWEGKNEYGINMPSGTYLCHMQSYKTHLAHKLLLIR
jgi:ligand-binding sensor domain-containing protein